METLLAGTHAPFAVRIPATKSITCHCLQHMTARHSYRWYCRYWYHAPATAWHGSRGGRVQSVPTCRHPAGPTVVRRARTDMVALAWRTVPRGTCRASRDCAGASVLLLVGAAGSERGLGQIQQRALRRVRPQPLRAALLQDVCWLSLLRGARAARRGVLRLRPLQLLHGAVRRPPRLHARVPRIQGRPPGFTAPAWLWCCTDPSQRRRVPGAFSAGCGGHPVLADGGDQRGAAAH